MKLIYLAGLLVAAGVLDFMSTLVGLRLGLTESHPRFLELPFIATGLMVSMAVIIHYFPSVPGIVRKGLKLWMVVFAFLPSLSNLVLILKVIL